jgi:hypothetical protein
MAAEPFDPQAACIGQLQGDLDQCKLTLRETMAELEALRAGVGELRVQASNGDLYEQYLKEAGHWGAFRAWNERRLDGQDPHD